MCEKHKLTKEEIAVLKKLAKEEIDKIESNPWLSKKEKREKIKKLLG